jgi:hypothetical protein
VGLVSLRWNESEGAAFLLPGGTESSRLRGWACRGRSKSCGVRGHGHEAFYGDSQAALAAVGIDVEG